MTTCEEIEPQLTRWVDDDLTAAERERVDAHLAQCQGCRTHAEAERAARGLLQARREALRASAIPPALVRGLGDLAGAARGRAGHRRWGRLPLAIAATLALVFSGLTLHLATARSTTLLAAQLAADHVKCHMVEQNRSVLDPAAVRDRLASRYGFAARVPASRQDEQLRLIGARRCLTGEGTNAHLLYSYEGRPVSLYLVPASRHAAADVGVLGQRAIVWSRHNGTYVLVAGAGTPNLERVARYMEAVTE